MVAASPKNFPAAMRAVAAATPAPVKESKKAAIKHDADSVPQIPAAAPVHFVYPLPNSARPVALSESISVTSPPLKIKFHALEKAETPS